MGKTTGPENWPKAWSEMDKIRDLRKRTLMWKFLEVKK